MDEEFPGATEVGVCTDTDWPPDVDTPDTLPVPETVVAVLLPTTMELVTLEPEALDRELAEDGETVPG